jgi:hypothetical protein
MSLDDHWDYYPYFMAGHPLFMLFFYGIPGALSHPRQADIVGALVILILGNS